MITALYLITFAAVLLLSIKRIKERESISLYPIFMLGIAGLYLFIPAMVFMFGAYDIVNYDLIQIIKGSTNVERIVIYFYVVLCFAVVSIPQKMKCFNKLFQGQQRSRDKDEAEFVKVNSYNVCKIWFLVLAAIGLLCVLVMMIKIGPLGFIKYSGSARGEGNIQLQSGSLFAYATQYSRFLLAALVPGILMYEIKKQNKMRNILIVIFAFSLLLQIFNAGKTSFIIFLVPFFVYAISRSGVLKMKYLMFVAVGIVILIPLLDNVFFFIWSGENIENYRTSWNVMNYMMNLVRLFTYPYANMVMSGTITEIYGYRFFIDYLAIPVNLLPAALFGGFEVNTLYHLTTEYYTTVLSHQGGMPNDFLFFAYRQLGVVGIAVIGSVTGIIIKILDNILFEVKDSLDLLRINLSHYITTFSFASVVFILIEPLSALSSFPNVIFAVMITVHLWCQLNGKIIKFRK